MEFYHSPPAHASASDADSDHSHRTTPSSRSQRGRTTVAPPPRPVALPVNIENIPDELRRLRNWVLWRYELRRDKNGEHKWTKVPYNARTGQEAKVDDPETWATFEQAATAYGSDLYSGIGFCRSDDFVFLDADGERDPTTGELSPRARAIVNRLRGGAYIEMSPSGTGIHSVTRGKLPQGRRQWSEPGKRHTGIALYDANRFLTITGETLPESSHITDQTDALAEVHAYVFSKEERQRAKLPPRAPLDAALDGVTDEDLIQHASRAANGAKFRGLWRGEIGTYPSRSEADLALCSMLAFWTQRDAARIDLLFRRSGLMRPKWERQDYRERTIAAAISRTHDVWTPRRRK
jgi:putative DNA primase/helicase